MTDAAFLKLPASYEAALEAARRSLTIAKTVAEAHDSGRRLPAATMSSYLVQIEHDKAQLPELQEKLRQFKSWFRTH